MTVSRNGFYQWLKTKYRQETSLNAERDAHALACWKASRGSLGSRALSIVLRKEGFNLGRYATRSLMKRLGLSGRQRRHRYVIAKDINVAAPNHLAREFTVEAANKKWVTDITYIPTRHGWCYLAAVVDLYSRKVVGWDVAKTMTAELALSALRLAKVWRQPEGKVLVHSDQGSQYTGGAWRQYAEDNDIKLSQSRRGNCWDNAVMERFFGSLKSEWIKDRCYQDADSAKQDISKYVIEYYNMWRPHTHLGGFSPNEYETAA